MSRSFHPRRPKSAKARAAMGLPPRYTAYTKTYQWSVTEGPGWSVSKVSEVITIAENLGIRWPNIQYLNGTGFLLRVTTAQEREVVRELSKALQKHPVIPDWSHRRVSGS